MSICVSAYAHACLQRLEVSESPGSAVTSSYALFIVGAGKETWVLKSHAPNRWTAQRTGKRKGVLENFTFSSPWIVTYEHLDHQYQSIQRKVWKENKTNPISNAPHSCPSQGQRAGKTLKCSWWQEGDEDWPASRQLIREQSEKKGQMTFQPSLSSSFLYSNVCTLSWGRMLSLGLCGKWCFPQKILTWYLPSPPCLGVHFPDPISSGLQRQKDSLWSLNI